MNPKNESRKSSSESRVLDPVCESIAVWAVNPFEATARPDRIALDSLREWARANGVRIQPVHVLYVSPSQGIATEPGTWVRELVAAVERELSDFMSAAGFLDIKEPKVLIQRSGLHATAADLVLQYAQDVHASWVLVSSRGQSGLRRMALGSFSETLLAKSQLPVWVFGHGTPASSDAKHIFFPTDFSKSSRLAFDQVIDQAARLGARVTLFHCVELPDPLVGDLGGSAIAGCLPVDLFVQDRLDAASIAASEWLAVAEAQGVRASFLARELAPRISEAILFEARRAGAGLIAMASHSGRLGAALLGSHARQVMRASEIPVWVFGPRVPLAERVA